VHFARRADRAVGIAEPAHDFIADGFDDTAAVALDDSG